MSLAVFLVTAPFAVTGDSRPGYPDPLTVISQWSSFQASRDPRPILLVTALPAQEKSGGIVIGVQLGGKLSETVPAASEVTLPDGVTTLPRVSARNAFDELRLHLDRKAAPGRMGTVVAAESVIQEFQSDRGFVSLPAWKFQLAGGGALVWPALPSRFFWRLGSLSPSSTVVQASASRTLPQITVWMDPRRGCGQRVTAPPNVRITESENVVVIGKIAPRSRAEFSRCAMTADLRAEAFTYELSSPLGERGLLDELGNVAVVNDNNTPALPGAF
ncbi:hypothetical protein GCM10009556_013030 [Acrocarpospora pleiomorpha]